MDIPVRHPISRASPVAGTNHGEQPSMLSSRFSRGASFFSANSLSKRLPTKGWAAVMSDSAKKSQRAKRPGKHRSFQIWIDGVGGYLVCPSKSVWIGQAIPRAGIDIPIKGDLRRRHACIELHRGEHLISPAGRLKIDGITARNGVSPLVDGQELQFGECARLKYKQPHPLSQTARLDFSSGNRTTPWSDAVLLMAQTLIIGPSAQNHIECPGWERTLILLREENGWVCRTSGEFEVDGQICTDESPIRLDSIISGEDFSLTLEPVNKAI